MASSKTRECPILPEDDDVLGHIEEDGKLHRVQEPLTDCSAGRRCLFTFRKALRESTSAEVARRLIWPPKGSMRAMLT
jgi:hypothetical protein